MIKYTDILEDINEEMLVGFFDGWKSKPSKSTHMAVLRNSFKMWIAVDVVEGRVIGFINAVSDGVLSAYIPLLEVLPEYQKKGVGSELLKKMLCSLKQFYMVDLLCDTDKQGFYENHGMVKAAGMLKRNYE